MTRSAAFAVSFALGLGLLAPTHLFAQAAIAVNGAPPAAAVTIVAGTTAAVSITSGAGSTTDWVALYAVGAADGAYLDWRYLNGATAPPATGLTDATVAFSMPVTPGSYEFRLFASNGFSRLATSGNVDVVASPASLLVNGVAPPTAAAASAGTVVLVEVNDGPANPGDWVGFYAAGAPDGSYLSWRYLNNSTALPSVGSETSMLTFQAPSASGSYEFRFFISNSFTRLATSTALVVGTLAAQLVVNGTAPPGTVTLGAGSTAVVSVSDGPGNTTDWVALAVFGSAPNAYVDWRYLSGTTAPPSIGVSAATLTFAMPTIAGEYEFRFFANNSFDQIASSSRVTVLAPIAALTVNGVAPPTPLSVPPETPVAVSLTGARGTPPTGWPLLARGNRSRHTSPGSI